MQPQLAFARLALERGFAVFALDSTADAVTDAEGRACGKRFDFSVLERANVDLPYIERVIREVVPARRPPGSSPALFVTGLSTGGYMTTRAAAELGAEITAFAPISAGDPFGTDAICDAGLSRRKSALGILVDRETLEEIVEDGACAADASVREARWPAAKGQRPPFRQLHSKADGIVDLSCMLKAKAMLERNGFHNGEAPFVLPARGGKNPFQHLWLDDYNAPLLEFFAEQVLAITRK